MGDAVKVKRLDPVSQLLYSRIVLQLLGYMVLNYSIVYHRSFGIFQNCGVNDFKKELDKVLEKIPDEPLLPGYTMMRRRETNSVFDMISIMKV